DAGARGVDVDLGLVRRALDLDVAHAGVVELLLDERLELEVLVQPLGVVLLLVPARRPRLDDAEAEPGRMCFLTHVRFPAYFSSVTTTVRWLVRWLMRLARPIERGIQRLAIVPPSTAIVWMRSWSIEASPPDLSSALAAADLIALE